MIDADELYRQADRLASLSPTQIRREAIFRALVIGEHSKQAGDRLASLMEGEESGKWKAESGKRILPIAHS